MTASSATVPSGLTVRPATPGDLGPVREILAQGQLPLDGVTEILDTLIVGERDARIVATAGLEVCGSAGLVRSVAIRPEHRGEGFGTEIVQALLNRAKGQGLSELYLLTTTAADFFHTFGFQEIERRRAPVSIRRTREFSTLCPESAVLMFRSV